MKQIITYTLCAFLGITLFTIVEGIRKRAGELPQIKNPKRHGANWIRLNERLTCVHTNGRVFDIEFAFGEDGTVLWREVEKIN